jgi:hypothetical protein
MFLGMAAMAMLVSLAARFVPSSPATGFADFSTGLATGILLGLLLTWKGDSRTLA